MKIALWVLGALGVINLARGSFHWLSPDSGAGSVAGFDLSNGGGEAVIFILAMIGIIQMFNGFIDLFVVFKARAYVFLLLVLETAKHALVVFTQFVFKPPPVDIPGRYFASLLLVILAATLVFAGAQKKK